MASAIDSFLTGVTTMAAITPAGLMFGVTPYGAPEGWTRADTIEGVTGWDVSDRIDAPDGGAVGATANTSPAVILGRGADVAIEGGNAAAKKAGWLPEWWEPWMTKAAIAVVVVGGAAVVAFPYVAPFIAARKAAG